MNVSKVERAKRKSLQWRPLKVAIVSGTVGFSASGLAHFIFHPADWMGSICHGVVGLFLGLMAAPQFSIRRFKMPLLWQSCCGGLGGLVFSLARGFDTNYVVLSIVVGILLGVAARFWIQYADLP